MSDFQVVILAAGLGTRLGRPLPKTLTELDSGGTILSRQLSSLKSAFGDDVKILIVVGFKMDLILEAAPEATFVYNERYDRTNTSKSLLKALNHSYPGHGVLWMNADVVFDPAVLDRLKPSVEKDQSSIIVDTSTVAEEEVKYTLDDSGYINQISKKVTGAMGEALGINYVSSNDKDAFIQGLDAVDDQEYFEGGIEHAIKNSGARFVAVDVSDLSAVEVDDQTDLDKANSVF